MLLRNGGKSSDWLFVAMSHWRLGNREEARRWYDKAAAWMDQYKAVSEELLRFRAEAEETLNLKESNGDPDEAETGSAKDDTTAATNDGESES